MIKKMALMIGTLFILDGCTSFSSKQDPAPVYHKNDSASTPQKDKVEDKPVTTEPKLTVVRDPVILQQQEIPANTQPRSSSSSVVVALLSDADMSYQRGHYDESVQTIERALRIEPRNALLLYKLAVIRLQQEQPELAENLAKKSALLAQGDAQLKKKNWLLIAQAREQLDNPKGAKEALKKAGQF